MGHIVTATLIVAKFGDSERYFEKSSILPAGVSAAERKRLVGAGLVEAVEEAPTADPDAEQAAAEAAAKAAAEAEAKDNAAAEAEAKAKAAAAAKSTPAKQ